MASTSTSQNSEFQSKVAEFQEEKIRVRAYELYLRRGGQHGRALEDWLQAEKELTANGACAPAVRPSSAPRPRGRKSK